MKIKTIGLIGLGRFGTMAYQYLRASKEIRVYDANESALRQCPDARNFADAAAADLVVLTVPISAVERVCQDMARLLRHGQLVVDTCSVKEKPIKVMLRELPEYVEILGTHPLFGPDSGKKGIAGLKIALCPVRIQPGSYQAILRYLRSLGLITLETTPEEHDRQIARTQAVFHLIAQACKRLNWGGEDITTPGPETFFNLLKSVQNDTDQLFFDLQRENRHAAKARSEFIEEVIRLDGDLSRDMGKE
ncbi:MAG: prephenate dehydrogenase/arogenate dehydrogenase family protein [Acidobacteriota bacterium]